jgi:hypothetical protein
VERNLKGSESHDQGMPQGFHIRASDGSLALCPGKSFRNIGREASILTRAAPGSHTGAKDMCRANPLEIMCLAGNESVMRRKSWVN